MIKMDIFYVSSLNLGRLGFFMQSNRVFERVFIDYQLEQVGIFLKLKLHMKLPVDRAWASSWTCLSQNFH